MKNTNAKNHAASHRRYTKIVQVSRYHDIKIFFGFSISIRSEIIAILIASTIAYYFMYSWLQNYAYSIQISWWMFATAWISAILFAMLTMSFQAIKAGLSNPINVLRTE